MSFRGCYIPAYPTNDLSPRLLSMLRNIGPALVVLLLGACGGSEGPYTGLRWAEGEAAREKVPSQNPVVRLTGKSLSTVLGTTRISAGEAIIKFNTERGARLMFRNDFGLVFSSPDYSTADRVSDSSSANRSVEVRLKFDLTDEGPNTKVAMSIVAAEYPNTSREIDTDISYTARVFDKSLAVLKALSEQYPVSKRGS